MLEAAAAAAALLEAAADGAPRLLAAVGNFVAACGAPPLLAAVGLEAAAGAAALLVAAAGGAPLLAAVGGGDSKAGLVTFFLPQAAGGLCTSAFAWPRRQEKFMAASSAYPSMGFAANAFCRGR